MKRDLLSKYLKVVTSLAYPSHIVMVRIFLKTLQRYGLLDIYLTEVFKQRDEVMLHAKFHNIFNSLNYRQIHCSTIIDHTLAWHQTSQGSRFWDTLYCGSTKQAKDIRTYFYNIYRIWSTVTATKKTSKAL